MERILSLIRSNVDYVQWSNFYDPLVLWAWAQAQAGLWLFVLFALVASRLVLPRSDGFSGASEEFALRVGLGLSLASLGLSVLGLLGLYHPAWLLAAGGALLLASLWGRWRSALESLGLLRRVLLENKAFWLVMALLSFAALLPPRWFDEGSYHLVYPLKWVEAGGIYTDASMKVPLYTFNFHVLHVPGAMAGGFALSHLLSWLTGGLAFLSLKTLAGRLSVWAPLAAMAAWAFLLTPVVQQYLALSYHDVPLMAFLLLSAHALVLAGPERSEDERPRWLVAAGLLAGMFVGMKTSGAFFVPLFFALAWQGLGWRKAMPFLLVLSLFGGMWYFRNILLVGDPIPPSLTFALGRANPYWTHDDYLFQMRDIQAQTDEGWTFYLRLPWEMVVSHERGPLRYWPFLGYTLLFPLGIFLLGRWRERSSRIVLALAFFGAALWAWLSPFTRYGHFAPLMVLVVALLFEAARAQLGGRLGRTPARLAFLALALFFFFGPKGSAFSYFKQAFAYRVPTDRAAHNAFVGWQSPPYLLDLLDTLPALGLPPRQLYLWGLTQHKYHFQKAGYPVVGDGVGRFRFGDLAKAHEQGRAAEFLDSADCAYLLLDRRFGQFPQRLESLGAPGLRELRRDSSFGLWTREPAQAGLSD